MNILTQKLEAFIKQLSVNHITEERKKTLQLLIDYIQLKVSDHKPIRLIFICTHNSRRSHLAQIWAETMAFKFNIKHITCYSAGTEVTNVYPMVIETLQDTGFQIEKIGHGNNPIYGIKYAENELPIIGFSKKLDTHFNPNNEFCAIMTCLQADKACPFIAGAEKRIPIPFNDPKKYDNTPKESEKYHEIGFQIANEMYYVFSKIHQIIS